MQSEQDALFHNGAQPEGCASNKAQGVWCKQHSKQLARTALAATTSTPRAELGSKFVRQAAASSTLTVAPPRALSASHRCSAGASRPGLHRTAAHVGLHVNGGACVHSAVTVSPPASRALALPTHHL